MASWVLAGIARVLGTPAATAALVLPVMAVATPATPAAAAAQAAPQAAVQAAAEPVPKVDGRWEARWASGIRTERDGSITVEREADAILRLASDGDTVSGTWVFEFPGTGRSVWFVQGRVQDGRLTLTATENETEIPPPPGQEVLRQEWSGVVTGDRIEGEMWMVLGLPGGRGKRSGPRPWSATRSPG